MELEQLDVGYVAGPHGVRGGVRIKLHDPTSGALRPGTPITLTRQGATVARPSVVDAEAIPGKPGMHRVRLEGVASREAAEALKGCAVLVARDALPALAVDEFYLVDAIGLPVVREAEPRELGTIVGLTSNGVQDLFEVEWVGPDHRKHRWLLPVLPAIVRDVDATRVLAELPAGFLPEPLEVPT